MGTLRLVATSSSVSCGLNFVRRLHDVSNKFLGRSFSFVNLSQLRPPKSGCSRRESHLYVATVAGPPTNNKMLDEVDPIGFGRKTRHLFDELQRKLPGLVQFSCSSGDQDIIVIHYLRSLRSTRRNVRAKECSVDDEEYPLEDPLIDGEEYPLEKRMRNWD